MLAQNANSYGYIGVDGGYFHEDAWFYFGKSGPGFFVQRAGESLFGTGAKPLRLADKGVASYGCLSVLGGTSRSRNARLLMNFTGYTMLTLEMEPA
jgi:hypothetical protein